MVKRLQRWAFAWVMLSSVCVGSAFAQATQVRVETRADGLGTVVPAQNLASGDTLRVYAISRTATGVFVANVAATWSLDSLTGGVVPGDLVPSADGKSALFTGHSVGSAYIRAASGLLIQVPSGKITVIPGAAARLTISQEPSAVATAGVPFPQQPIVRIEDANGNLVTSDNTTTVTATRLLGTGTLQGTTSRLAVGGIVTFTDLRHNVAGTINIRFTSSPTLTPDTSANIIVNPNVAARLVFVQQPTNDTAGTIITPPITVQVQDSLGNNVGGVRSVVMAIHSGTGVLSGTTTQNTNSSGLATFSNLSINLAGTKQLKATSAGLDSAVSASFVISHAAATRLGIQTQPSATATAGVVFAQQPVVRIEDQFGNLVTADNSTVVTAARSAGSGTLQGTVTRTASGGLVTFTDLRHNVAGTISIQFTSSPVLTPVTSSNIVVSAAAPKKVVFVQQPTNTVSGVSISPPVTVQLQDTFSNNVAQSGVAVLMTLSSGTGTLSGTTTQNTNASGLATFSNLSINLVGQKVLTASSAGLTSAVSNPFIITPGPPATITATAGTPQSALVNTTFATLLQATVLDAAGNRVPSVTVTFAAPTTGPRGTFAGGLSSINVVTDTAGVARATAFTANTIAGSYSDTARVAGVATPALFSLTNTPGPARQILATAGTPQSTQISTAFPVNFKATVRDTFGNPLSNVLVRFTRPISGPSGTFFNNVDSAFTDTSGAATAAVFVANFIAGSYVVTAATPGPQTPAVFNLTNTPGPPAQIIATAGTPQSTQVGTPFATNLQVAVRDGANNAVPGVLVKFTRPGTGASGTFAGGIDTVRTTTGGIATAPQFTANTIAGSYTVFGKVFTGSDSIAAPFSLTNLAGPPGSITIVAGHPQSTTVNTTFATNLAVVVRDANNNPIVDTTVTFTAPSSGPSGKFGTSRTAQVRTNASGIATAPAFTADTLAGSYQVSASAPGVSTPAQFSLTNNPGPAARVLATAGTPQSTQIGTPFATNFRARVTDQFSNPLRNIVVTWTRPASGPSGTFLGNVNTGTTDSTGVATAQQFTANFIAGSYTVKASAPGVPDSAVYALTNTAAAPSVIQTTGGSNQTTTVNTLFPLSLQATVRDQAGNPVPNVAVTFTSPLTGASGRFANDSTTYTVNTNASGVATATVRANTAAGSWAAEARVSGVTAPAIFSLRNDPGAPATVTATAGAVQSAVVRRTYGINFEVTVRDAFSNPVPNVLVQFVKPPLSGPSGTFAGGVETATTNANGVATAVAFTANERAGAFVVTANVAGVGTPANFSLTNLADVPDTIVPTAGTPQATTVNTPFPQRLTVVVRDTFNNPVPNRTVTFNVPTSGPSGTFAGGVNIAQTDNAGIAQAPVLTANGSAGQWIATATVGGVSTPATFALTNNPGSPHTIIATSGTPQTAQVATTFPDTMKALVRDSSGNPVPNVVVTFLAPSSGPSGSFNGSNQVLTGTNGVAVAPTFTANNIAGTYQVTASVQGVATPAIYQLQNTPGSPATISTIEPSSQSTIVGTTFPIPLQALVRDQFGNPVPNRTVTFTSPSTGASCNFPSSGVGTATTNDSGVARIVAVANTIAGQYTVSATVTGAPSPAFYTLTNLAAPPSSIAATRGSGQSAQVGTRFPIDLEATVSDAFGNLVPNALVRFTPPTSGPSGTFENGIDTVRTDQNGLARARPFTANSIAGGPYQVTATAVGGTNPMTSYSLTNLSGPPGSIQILQGSGQAVQVNTTFPIRFRVLVRDSNGNPVRGRNVHFEAPGGGATGTFQASGGTATDVETDTNGIAEASAFTASLRAGAYIVTASAPNVSAPVQFAMRNLAGPPRHIRQIAGSPQQTQVSTAFPVNFQAEVLDTFFNGTPNTLVRWLTPAQSGPSGTFFANRDTMLTDTNGIATAAVFIANIHAGQYLVKGVVANVADTAWYDLRNLPGPAASITAVDGTNQTTRVNTPFPSFLRVAVRDGAGNGVPNALVRFTYPLTGPSGRFENGIDTVRTDDFGFATSPLFIANTSAGRYVVRAATDGVTQSADFNLTNVATSPYTIIATGGSPQSAPVTTLFALRLQAMVRDTFGNPIPNLVVTFTPPSNGPSCSFEGSNSVLTNDSGMAVSNPFRANNIAGSYTVRGEAQGLNDSVNYSLTNTTGTAGSITIVAGRTQSAVVNTVFDTAFSVLVTDNFGNPVSGVDVTFSAPTTGPSGSFPGGATTIVVQSGSNGIATASAFRANTIAGSYTVTASSPTIGAPATFNLTNITGPLSTFLVEAENGGAIGLQLAIVPFSIRISARDAFNNLIANFTGTVTITSTGTLLAGGGVTPTFNNGELIHRIIMRQAASNVRITATRTTGGTPSGTSNAFQVNNPVPRIVSVSPPIGNLLDTLLLTVRGSNFVDSVVTSLNMGTNITVNALTVDDSTQLRATVTIGVTADTGSRTISVSNAQPGGGPSNTIPFVVEVPMPRPPILGGPPDSSRIYSPIATLSWSSTPLALAYRLQVATDAGFTGLVFEDSTLTVTTMTIGPPVLQRGATYFWRVRATNPRGTGEYSRAKVFTIQPLYPSSYTLATTVAYPTRESPGDYLPSDYRLVGFPGDPSRNNIRLDQLLGGTQNVDWVVYRDNGAAENYYVAFNANDPAFNLQTGRAFWVLKKGPWTISNVSVPSAPLDTNSFVVTIPLQRGWNIITNPYTSAVLWNDVRAINGILDPIYGFNGTFSTSNSMVPYAGYYFFNAESLATLKIPYGSFTTSPLGKPAYARSEGEWVVGMTFEVAGISDSSMSFGVRRDASAGMDRFEYRKPRGFVEIPSIAFIRPEWDRAYSEFASDFRPAVEQLEVWEMTVRSPFRNNLKLTFDGVAEIPAHLKVFLVDEQQAKFADLRNDPTYRFDVPTGSKILKVVVGTEEAVREVLNSILPKEFALGNNFPNPFNPTTTIPIAVPQTADVSLKVYNILGEEVRTVFVGTLEPGRYFFVWDGKNNSGINVATGMYIARFATTTGKAFSGKMLLMK